MEIDNIFYGVGIFFMFLAIGYFIGTYLDDVPAQIKTILAFLLSIILFLIGDYLRRKNI